jgi:hypothetical protein
VCNRVRGVRTKAQRSKVNRGTKGGYSSVPNDFEAAVYITYWPEGGNESLCRALWNRKGVASQILPPASDSEGRDRHQAVAFSKATLPTGRPGACPGSVPS